MFRSEMHGQRAREAEALHRQLCSEMLDHLAAGGGLHPYPFGDALYLFETARPPARLPATSGGLLGRLARVLTPRQQRPRMESSFVEGSDSGGRSRNAEHSLRGAPA
jgi:hypothetical protein